MQQNLTDKVQEVLIYQNLLINKKIVLSGLKQNIDNLDIGKLRNTPANLSKLSNVVEKEVVKKDVFHETTDTSDLV